VDGATLTIGEAPRGDRQLLFVFTRTCEFCRQSVPAWRSLIHAVQNDSTISVVAVTLDSLEHGRAWARDHGLPVPVVRFSTPKIRALYRAGSVPITLLIDERGQVDFALVGALLNGASLDSVRHALGAKHDPSG
jgi:peroxiredoxin